jgi:Family of unknown function (DUF5343)
LPAATLPYLTATGSIKNAFERIKTAATPDKVTGDFVSTKLLLKGGTGRNMLPFLKKIGFVGTDGSSTDLYKRFRNPATAGPAVAEAVKKAYRPLLEANEYFFELPDKELLALIVQVTGAAADSQVPKLTLSTLKALKSYADFEAQPKAATEFNEISAGTPAATERYPARTELPPAGRLGLNLSYTINLNLPATSEQAVFNAIFRSLKEHLLSDE